jgi:EmrB/QacA subfamily drug resistance transporter
VGTGVFLATLDSSIVNIAMPTIQRELQTDFAIVQWVVLAYLLTVTTLLLGIGRVADIVGKKLIYTTGFAVFTIGSALCAAAPTVGWLIAARIVQALGAAMVFALGPAIVTEAFPSSERGRALGFIGLAVSAGIITGPTLGGYLTDAFSWHAIFLVNVPVGILALVMAWRFVPNIQPPGGQQFDYGGATAFFISLMALLLGLTFGQQHGFSSPPILALLATWLVFLGIFIWIELRVSDPIIDLRLFRNHNFSVSLITGYIAFLLLQGALFLIPFYLENARGFSTLTAGLLLAVLPVTLGLTSPISGWLSDKVGVRVITIVGLLVMTIGYSMFLLLDAQTSMLAFVLILAPMGTGMGIFVSPNNSVIMGSVPPERLGIASGLLGITRTLGQVTGIAILSAIWESRVDVYAPGTTDATQAPIAVQVTALHDTYIFTVVLISCALLLTVGVWLYERQVVRRGAAEV